MPSSTPSARIIWALSPVARMAVPRLVRKKTEEHAAMTQRRCSGDQR